MAEPQKGRGSFGFWSQLWKGPETQYTPREQQLLTVYTVFLQREPLMKEEPTVVRTSACEGRGGFRICSIDPPQPWLTPLL